MKKITFLLCCMIIAPINGMLVQPLPKEINAIIVNNIPLYPCFKTVEEVNDVMVALACVNKSWNKFINNSENTLSIIKKLSKRFDWSDMEIVEELSIKKARSRYAIQIAALYGWNGNDDSFVCDKLGRLCKSGLDLNFIYDDDCTMLLKVAFANVHEHTGHAPKELFNCRHFQIGKWLIDHGADINITTKDGASASILIFSIFNNPLIELLLNHPKFNIHYQDNAGDTVLHCCFQQRIRFDHTSNQSFCLKLYEKIYPVVERLIRMKANPSLPNKQGETSFDLAKRTGYEPFLKILDPQYNS